jgi:DNA (cytosine-5)-methyltransferase 1
MKKKTHKIRKAAAGKQASEIQVIDLFCGCGGMSCGFHGLKSQGLKFRVIGALDVDVHANATYSRMIGLTPLQTDIRTLSTPRSISKVLRGWSYDCNKPLVLIACAPCQGFSSHRKRHSGSDARNSLLSHVANFAAVANPDVVIMENVPEMLHISHWRHFSRWRRAMEQNGYAIRTRIYNMAQFGVPQERFRALVIASKRWNHFDMPSPTHAPTKYETVRMAIGDLPRLRAGEADPEDPMHLTSKHRDETVNILRLIPHDGGSQCDLPDNVGPDCLRRVDGFRDVYGRMFWDRPANAITTRCRTPSAGRYAHPEQNRGLSVREAALLQGFPRDYLFEGPFDDKFKQIGNSVSPMFAKAIAKHIAKEWMKESAERPEFSGDITKPIVKSISSALAAIKRKAKHLDVSVDYGTLLAAS